MCLLCVRICGIRGAHQLVLNTAAGIVWQRGVTALCHAPTSGRAHRFYITVEIITPLVAIYISVIQVDRVDVLKRNEPQ